MKRFILISLMFCSLFLRGTACLAAVDQGLVTVKMIDFGIIDNRFYIKEVMDGRKDKSQIGERTVGLFNLKKMPLVLDEAPEKSIKSLMDKNFAPSEGKIPIVLKINVLKVSETSENIGEYVLAVLRVTFYKEQEGRLARLFEMDTYNEMSTSNDYLDCHAENISLVFQEAIQAFLNSDWEKVDLIWKKYSDVQTKNLPTDYQVSKPSNKKTVLLGEVGSGLAANYASFDYFSYDENENMFSNYAISADYLDFPFKIYAIQKDEKTSVMLLMKLKGGDIKRINNSDFAFLNDGGLDFGVENVFIDGKSYEGIHFVLGIELSQNIVYLPKNRYGLVFAAGIYENLLAGARLNQFDLGLKFSAGVQF